MKILSNLNKKILLSVGIIIFILIFITLFIVFFKFDKYYKCYLYDYNNYHFLVVDDQTYEYLLKDGKVSIEYNDINFLINYQFFNKFNNMYVYVTDFSKLTNQTNECQILIKNLNIFQLLKG